MLDLNRLQDQFSEFTHYQSNEQVRMQSRLEAALCALVDCDGEWETFREHACSAKPGWLVADLREAPGGTHTCGDRPTPITVVATDGSQIYPDRHVEPTCYLLNVSRIAFQYGTVEQPIMEAVPDFRYRSAEVREAVDELEALLDKKATSEVVSALRDEQELRALLETAQRARVPDRPLVAMADGTLIRWMLRRMQNRELEQRLIARYATLLQQFREEGIPLCSYISMPGNTEVVNLLRLYLEEDVRPPAEEASLEGLPDRKLFERILRPGQRSAVFESGSHIQREYGAADRICYFYVHLCDTRSGEGEVGRVEVPHWVADDAELLERVHATVLSECEKGDGYPMILAEAHERAVVRAREKELFYELIERRMQAAGLPATGSRKAASKRRPMV